MGVRVEAKNREPVDKLLRRFKKLCEKEGLQRDISTAHGPFESPSERRRRKALKAAKNRAKYERIEAAKAERHRDRTARKKLRSVAGAVLRDRGVAGPLLGAAAQLPEREAGE